MKLCRVLRKNTTLTTIHAEKNSITQNTHFGIKQLIKDNASLVDFTYDILPLGSDYNNKNIADSFGELRFRQSQPKAIAANPFEFYRNWETPPNVPPLVDIPQRLEGLAVPRNFDEEPMDIEDPIGKKKSFYKISNCRIRKFGSHTRKPFEKITFCQTKS